MEETTILFNTPTQKKVPVSFQAHRWGQTGNLIVSSPDHQVWFALTANIGDLVVELRRAAAELESLVCTRNEAGIIRAEAEPEPAAEFSIKPTGDDLNGDPAHDWPLVQAHFGGVDGTYILDVFREFYRNRFGVDVNKLRPAELPAAGPRLIQAAPSQLDRDLTAIRAGGEAGLWKPDGRANQSEIARRLGVRNAGAYRDRVLAVVEALEASTTSTTTATAPAATTKATHAARQAA